MCLQHWRTVWNPPRPKRRRSKSKNRRQVQEMSEDAKPTDPLLLIAEKPPWVATTPQARLPKVDLPPVPPAPVLNPPPMAASGPQFTMAPEKAKQLELLQGLRATGMTLPSEMLVQLQELEDQSKAAAPLPTLSHSHLNRWKRLRAQIQAQVKRIQDVDSSWTAFIQAATARVTEHATMYQRCRQELLEGLATKKAELQTVREQITAASQTLLEEKADSEPMPEAMSTEALMKSFQEATAQVAQVIPIEDQEDMEDVGENAEDAEVEGRSTRKPALKAFSHHQPTSPSRVAPTIGKTKGGRP